MTDKKRWNEGITEDMVSKALGINEKEERLQGFPIPVKKSVVKGEFEPFALYIPDERCLFCEKTTGKYTKDWVAFWLYKMGRTLQEGRWYYHIINKEKPSTGS